MSERAAHLALERRKLAFLKAKVAEAEARIRVLESIKDDPFDAMLEKELAAADTTSTATPPPALPVAVQTSAPGPREAADAESQGQPHPSPSPLAPVFQWGQQPRTPRKMPPHWARLLTYIGLEGKTYDEVKLYIKNRGLQLSDGAARTQLMIYRTEFGFVENPKKGFYRATERALSYIEALEGKSPALQGGGSQTQPEPLTREAA